MKKATRFLIAGVLVSGITVSVWASPGALAPIGMAWDTPAAQADVREIPVASTGYLDGTYYGRRESAYYGWVQVEAVVLGGNLIRVRLLSYPNDNGTSRSINATALPILIQESVHAQGSHVRFVSGATFTSEAYHLSLHTALLQAVS